MFRIFQFLIILFSGTMKTLTRYFPFHLGHSCLGLESRCSHHISSRKFLTIPFNLRASDICSLRDGFLIVCDLQAARSLAKNGRPRNKQGWHMFCFHFCSMLYLVVCVVMWFAEFVKRRKSFVSSPLVLKPPWSLSYKALILCVLFLRGCEVSIHAWRSCRGVCLSYNAREPWF